MGQRVAADVRHVLERAQADGARRHRWLRHHLGRVVRVLGTDKGLPLVLRGQVGNRLSAATKKPRDAGRSNLMSRSGTAHFGTTRRAVLQSVGVGALGLASAALLGCGGTSTTSAPSGGSSAP